MNDPVTLPVLPLRELVLYPGTTSPISAGRPGTLRAIETALKDEKRLIFAVAARAIVKQVTPELLHSMGTVARIGQVQRGLGGVQLVLHGEYRAAAVHVTERDGYLEATLREVADLPPLDAAEPAFQALYKEARGRAAELAQKSGLPEEMVQQTLAGVSDPGRFADLVAGYIDLKTPERQSLLEALSVEDRLRRI